MMNIGGMGDAHNISTGQCAVQMAEAGSYMMAYCISTGEYTWGIYMGNIQINGIHRQGRTGSKIRARAISSRNGPENQTKCTGIQHELPFKRKIQNL